MKRKSLFVLFLLLFAGIHAYAQVENRFSRHLELDLGLGTALYYGENDWKVANKLEMFTFPAIDLYLTGWVSPVFGIGIGVNGAPFKGLYQSAAGDGVNFRPSTLTYYKNAGSKYEAEKLAVQAGSYLDISFLAHLDLMNVFGGSNTSRLFDIDAFAGGGCIFGFSDSGNNHDITINAGLMNSLRLSQRLRLWLNVRGAIVPDFFDGESYLKEPTKTHMFTNQKLDYLFGTTIGISFNFGKE